MILRILLARRHRRRRFVLFGFRFGFLRRRRWSKGQDGSSLTISRPQFLGDFNQTRIQILVKASEDVLDGESYLIIFLSLHFGDFAVTARAIDAVMGVWKIRGECSLQ